MTSHGDDCYFYYYSTCTKGGACPFRHCEAAMGTETVCGLWREGRCFRPICKFRHMEITKNRREIPCYWEKQPAGCQKPHCAFLHERPRRADAPPCRVPGQSEEQQPEEAAPPPAAAPPPGANPQLRGVKTEGQEAVPSPTHPPVVINPADDDEDEDDPVSEEGEDGRVGASPRRAARSGHALIPGGGSLEEVRLRRALKASLRRAGHSVRSPEPAANGETGQPPGGSVRGDLAGPGAGPGRRGVLRVLCPDPADGTGPRGGVLQRLGRTDPGFRCGRGLAWRLGGVIREEESAPAREPGRSVKQRLGRTGAAPGPEPGQVLGVSVRPGRRDVTRSSGLGSGAGPDQIHIKTLDQIREEKAAKTQNQRDVPVRLEITRPVLARTAKRSVTMRDAAVGHAQTAAEVTRVKKNQQEEQNHGPKRSQQPPEENPEGAQSGRAGPEDPAVGRVRVKTLQEIRREKAERLRAHQNQKQQGSDSQDNSAKKARLVPPRTAVQGLVPADGGVQEAPPVQEGPGAAARVSSGSEPLAETSYHVQVKTFQEIMWEKRLRKQEVEEPAGGSPGAEPGRNRATGGALKRKLEPKGPPRKITSLPPPAAADGVAVATGGAAPPQDKAQEERQNGSPEHTNGTVRPRLNVRPSVVRPAVQKKRGAEPSAVAAVKPLSSAPAGPEEPPQECRRPRGGPQGRFSGSGPGRSPAPPPADPCPAARESHPVQSPASKCRPRRGSAATRPGAEAVAVDDFEELISQFSGDQPEEAVDPDIGEEALLQELSEMIDS